MTDKDERIEELERQNQALEAQVDALSKKLKTLTKVVIGEERVEIDEITVDNGVRVGYQHEVAR